jgi:predicted dehydrogenase
MSEKRRVKVDLDELSAAFEIRMLEADNYLDLETGKVVMVTHEARGDLEEIYAEIYGEDGSLVVSLEEYLQQRGDLQGWYKETLLEADQVERDTDDRFLSVDPGSSHDDYRDMERFIRRVEDGRLRARLWDAIQGRGAFRRFKDTLARYPGVEERWYAFKAARIEERVLAWLAYHGIEPIMPAEEGE